MNKFQYYQSLNDFIDYILTNNLYNIPVAYAKSHDKYNYGDLSSLRSVEVGGICNLSLILNPQPTSRQKIHRILRVIPYTKDIVNRSRNTKTQIHLERK